MPASTTSEQNSAATNAPAGMYLTFHLGREIYGITVFKVREIIRLAGITFMPQMPAFVKGVINLRGKIIPVVDLRLKFQLGAGETNERSCIVVVQTVASTGRATTTGLVVDAVEEVVNISTQEMEPAPDFGASLDTTCILGLAKVKGVVKTLLDIDRLLRGESLVPAGESPGA